MPMAHHDIKINLQNGHAVPALSAAGDLFVGDTVSYSSPDGKARVVFDENGSPFGDSRPDAIQDRETRTVTKVGTFKCKCFIEIGWSPEHPESGGDHDVKPGSP